MKTPTPVPKIVKEMKPANDFQSGIHEALPREARLPVVFDVKHIHPVLVETIERRISQAVANILGPETDGNGQLLMFPELNEDQEVPESIAAQVRQSVMRSLSDSGIDIVIMGDTFKIVHKHIEADAFEEIGYGFA